MVEALQRGRQAKQADAPASPEPVASEQPAEAAENVEAEATSAPEDGDAPEKAQKKGKKDPDFIPIAAFKERIGRLNERYRSLQEQTQAKDLELSKQREAFTLLSHEYQRVREALEGGQSFDEKDEQIRQYELEKQVRGVSDKLMAEHQEALAKAAEQARIADAKEALIEEISEAIQTFPLIDRRELISAMKQNPGASAEDVARVLHERKVELAKQYLVQPKPAAPRTAVPQSQSIQPRYENSAAGMVQRLRAMRQST